MNNKNKGFASMDKDQVSEIAKKGGEARKDQLGPEGYAELERKGGQSRKEQIDSEEHSEKGANDSKTKREDRYNDNEK